MEIPKAVCAIGATVIPSGALTGIIFTAQLTFWLFNRP
jgi:hypothetical protein